jgi:MerR family transcriptional regulator, heat shock protein HspR
MSTPYEPSDDMPVYVISVAAQLSGMHPQTLRAYEKLGLVTPGRRQGSQGNSQSKGHRRYSMRDILALREIQRLSQEEGVNLNGIKLLLEQLRELEQARTLIAELHAELAQLRMELESTRAVAARLAELRRSGTETRSGREGRQGLVPVRSARVAIWEPMTGPASEPGPPRGDT